MAIAGLPDCQSAGLSKSKTSWNCPRLKLSALASDVPRDWTLAPSIVSDVVQLFTKRRPHSIGPPTQNPATCVRISIGPLEAYAWVLEELVRGDILGREDRGRGLACEIVERYTGKRKQTAHRVQVLNRINKRSGPGDWNTEYGMLQGVPNTEHVTPAPRPPIQIANGAAKSEYTRCSFHSASGAAILAAQDS
ncbi:hypothetical protein FIBSPDRAFT_887143 [Athelia psychrophila]|uniref:Uncharacterized protein n=1 Tax=Athelia psychrophila TaxID=1759441 RepID=A0A166Q103_9AGAM|nr:hypothetical protein FIBSPDRAFT_887143 [Fibularhizoctonia sp. CBS 109695]